MVNLLLEKEIVKLSHKDSFDEAVCYFKEKGFRVEKMGAFYSNNKYTFIYSLVENVY